MDSHHAPQPAIFLDRDGVVTREVGYVTEIEQMELLPRAKEALVLLKKHGLLRIVLTNQSAVARGMMTEETLNMLHHHLLTKMLPSKDMIDAIFYCPHFPPDEGDLEVPPYVIKCSCRKPESGLITQACEKYNVDLTNSYVVGDRSSDIELGHRVGLTTVLVRSGYGVREYDWISGIHPDFVFDDLMQAADFIVNAPTRYEVIEHRVFSTFDLSSDNRVIVLVGGQSRSGKTTLISYLLRRARLQGITTAAITLDNWILPAAQRTEDMNVLDRYQMPKMEADIANLLSGKKVAVSSYEALSRGNVRRSIELSVPLSGILFIEGVPALASDYLRSISSIDVFLDLDKAAHKERFSNFYLEKGLSADEIGALYRQRMDDELSIIENTRQHAQIVL